MHGVDKKNFSLKYIHNDQSSRLQQRYQNEAQLLEDLRLFMKQKSVIEKAYGQSMIKLCQQFSTKISQSNVAKNNKNHGESTLLNDAWMNYLNKVEDIGKVRVRSSEVHVVEVVEVCKNLKNHRAQVSKLVFDYLSDLQKEVLQCNQDIQKTQKVYKDKKTKEVQLKVKGQSERNKSPSKNHNQASEAVNEARNNYLLDLASLNSHLNEYQSSHLPELIQLIDGEMHEDWRKILKRASEMDRRTCHVTIKCCDDIDKSCDGISKDYDIRCFLNDNPCFTEVLESSFQPHNGDQTSGVMLTPSTQLDLEKEAKSSAMLVAREDKVIEKCQSNLEKIQLDGMTVEERAKHYETYFNLRRIIMTSKTRRTKALARLKFLNDGGLDTSTCLAEATHRMERRNEGGVTGHDNDVDTDSFDSGLKVMSKDDSSAELQHVQPKRDDHSSAVYPYLCSALYDYEAMNGDELSFKADDKLNMVGEGSGDGWLWAENEIGKIGLVPQNYISTNSNLSTNCNDQPSEEPAINPKVEDLTNQIVASETNRNSISTIHSSASETKCISIMRAAPPPPIVKEDHPEIVAKVEINLPDVVEEPTNRDQDDVAPIELVKLSDTDMFWTKALYAYEATCDEEISFSKGQLIKVTVTSRDVDDGWWEGEVKGQRGIFPSMIVEEIFVVSPTKQQKQHQPQSMQRNTKADGAWKSNLNLSLGVLGSTKGYSRSETPTEDDNNNNNNNNLNDDDDDSLPRQFDNSFNPQLNFQNSPPHQPAGVFPEMILKPIPIVANTPQKPDLFCISEDFFISGSSTLGRKTSRDGSYSGRDEEQDVGSFWYASPTSNNANDHSTPTSSISQSTRSPRQRPWKRPTDGTSDVQTPSCSQPNFDFATLPRSHRNQPELGMNSGHETGPRRMEMTDSGIEIRSNYLGLPQNAWFNDHSPNQRQQQPLNHDYNFHQPSNNINCDPVSPSHHWTNNHVANPTNLDGDDDQGQKRAFRLASESRESYI